MVADGLSAEREALEPDLVELRRALHRRPELAFEEHATQALVAERLWALGLEPRTGVGGTGVVADLVGERPGPMLLLRADLDALPVQEVPGRDYGSQVPGAMHACGHDAHTAALVGAATLLGRRRSELRGTVRLLFQPAEELARGALAVIADGALDGVAAALGAHVLAPMPYGTVAVWQGEALSGVDFYELRVRGETGHSAVAGAGTAALPAAARIAVALDELGLAPASVEGGRAANVVAGEVTLRGTLRWGDEGEREQVLTRVEEAAARAGTGHELRRMASAPVLVNDPALAAVVSAAVRATGRAQPLDPGRLPFSDDFAHIARRVPSCFFGVGSGGPGAPPHHHPAFDLDERAIGLMAEVFARSALD